MGFVAKSEGGEFQIAPQGVFPSRCIKMIDLGHQKVTWQGNEKIQHKILITWELLGDERMKDGKPFLISSRYTLSLGENATLKKILEGWRGKAFTLQEINSFDVSKVLGAYCLLNVVHAENNGKQYANVGGVMPLPKNMPKPEGVNPLVKFDVDDPDMTVFESFGDKLKETIQSCEEWNKKPYLSDLQDDIPQPVDDDIPF